MMGQTPDMIPEPDKPVLLVPSRTHALARRASWTLAVVSVLVAVSYVVLPPVRPVASRSFVFVLEINSALPVWSAAFAISAGLVAVGLVTHRLWLLIIGHAFAAVTTAWYGCAVIAGALLSDPIAGSPSGVMILGLSVAHWIGGLMWRETVSRAEGGNR